MAQIHLTTKNETLIIQGTLQEFLIKQKIRSDGKMKKKFKLVIACLLVVFIASCAGTTNTEIKTKEGVLVGAGVGAILGQAIGHNRQSTLVGAGIGAALGGLAGSQIGAYMDRQQAALNNAVAASEAASIRRAQNVLIATFKSDFLFNFDSASLKPGAYAELDRVARVLTQYPQTRIRVEGHTDSTGSAEYNMRLSQRRAEAVSNALIQRGVDPTRITTIGFGESQPVSSNPAANRRVELHIIPIRR